MKNLRSGNGGKSERGSKTLRNVNVLYLVSRCRGAVQKLTSGGRVHCRLSKSTLTPLPLHLMSNVSGIEDNNESLASQRGLQYRPP